MYSIVDRYMIWIIMKRGGWFRIGCFPFFLFIISVKYRWKCWLSLLFASLFRYYFLLYRFFLIYNFRYISLKMLIVPYFCFFVWLLFFIVSVFLIYNFCCIPLKMLVALFFLMSYRQVQKKKLFKKVQKSSKAKQPFYFLCSVM